jgi:pimeloyl-[acyl-carrier protein] methyl ester esterase
LHTAPGFKSLKLHTETTGHGPDLFLVHGWCLHSGVWSGILPELAPSYRVTTVDLPGHGRSHELSMPATLTELAQMLLEVAPPNATWLGWSLGGLACLRAAVDFPRRLRALVLVSTTPRFISAADWSQAMPLEQLQSLVTELREDYQKTVQRFLALQVRGDAAAQATLRRLRAVLFAAGEPSPSSLERGLMLLRDSDLRAELPYIQIPALIITGDYDRLIPVQAGEFLAAAMHGAQFKVFPKTAHAPFFSSPVAFISSLKQFLENLPLGSPVKTSEHPHVSALGDHRT